MWLFRKPAGGLEPAAPRPDRGEVLAAELSTFREQMAKLDQEYQQLRFKYFRTTRGGHSKLSVSDPAEARRIMGEVHRILCTHDRLKAQMNAVQQELALLPLAHQVAPSKKGSNNGRSAALADGA
jgi:hypothetical protein